MDWQEEEEASELLLRSTAEEEERGPAVEGLPDWPLIDEISIKLLEQGVGTFDTLQRALPSVVLAQIDQIIPAADANISTGDSAANACSSLRALKLFRLAQLQIDYLLKTQHGLVQKLERAEQRAKRLKRENVTLREEFLEGRAPLGEENLGGGGAVPSGEGAPERRAQWGRELFRCSSCSKLFLHANFLAEHILRRHNGQIEQAARGAAIFDGFPQGKASRVLGMDGKKEEAPDRAGTDERRKKSLPEKRSHFRKRMDARSATGNFEQRKMRQLGTKQQSAAAWLSTSVGEEMAATERTTASSEGSSNWR